MKVIVRAAVALALVGCSSTEKTVRFADAPAVRHRPDLAQVHAIGEDALLTFSKEGVGASEGSPEGSVPDLSIPVYGRFFDDPDSEIAVHLKSVVQIRPGVDYSFLRASTSPITTYPEATATAAKTPPKPLGSGYAEIRIDGAFLKRVSSEDPLVVTIEIRDVRERNALNRKRAAALAMATESRARPDVAAALVSSIEQQIADLRGRRQPFRSITKRFVFITADDYRRGFVKRRHSIADIRAFPLPSDTVRSLLGSPVDDNYYVVALALTNASAKDRLINTSLIRAYGRAMVFPADDGGDTLGAPFVVPVIVPPQSHQQVYTFVTDNAKWRPRQWIFRSLEFVGSLATVAANAFGGSDDLIRGLGIYTGTFIPEGKTLWPDAVPDYQKNIVNFSMQELVKVSKGGSVGYKFLYFPKHELHSLISDPSLFRVSDKDPVQPSHWVVSLEFEAFEIPYEETEANVESDSRRAKLSDLEARSRNAQYLAQRLSDDQLTENWSADRPAAIKGRADAFDDALKGLAGRSGELNGFADDAVRAQAIALAEELGLVAGGVSLTEFGKRARADADAIRVALLPLATSIDSAGGDIKVEEGRLAALEKRLAGLKALGESFALLDKSPVVDDDTYSKRKNPSGTLEKWNEAVAAFKAELENARRHALQAGISLPVAKSSPGDGSATSPGSGSTSQPTSQPTTPPTPGAGGG